AGKNSDSADGWSRSVGTTGVTRLIVTGTDLLPPFGSILPIVDDEPVVTMIVAVNVPFADCSAGCVGSIVTLTAMPAVGSVPLEGSIFTIHGRSAVAVNVVGALSPGICTCCTMRSLVPAGTLMFGRCRLIVVGTMTTRIVREYAPGVFVHVPIARTRSKKTSGGVVRVCVEFC